MGKELDRVSMEEVEAEGATALPDKEVMSLLDVNANVDLGLDLAAPVDLAVAANLNVAAPIEASAAANLLSPDAQAVAAAQQTGAIHQGISGSADATAPQHAQIDQNANPPETGGGGTVAGGETPQIAAPTADATTGDPVAGATDGPAASVDGATGTAVHGATGGAVDGATGAVGGAVDGAGNTVDTTAGDVTGGVNSLLSGGSLLDANINVHANANLTAPIDGAVAANANVAAPVDAAVAANIASDHAVAEAVAPQQVDVEQTLDNVEANATATQDAGIQQQ